jgi:hypothetical protein
MARRGAVRNLVRVVAQVFPGDPFGEALSAPRAADICRRLPSRAGTTVHGATNASTGNMFTGYTAGGLRVPTVATIPTYRNQASMFHTSVSDQQDAYRAILAARLARNSSR